MEEEKKLFHAEVGMILDAAVEVHRLLGNGLLEVGFIINFKHRRLETRRIIL